jgi:uncharacterized small protein (DUF1192 family)
MNEDEKRFLESIQKENAAAHAETRRHFDDSTEAIRRHFDVSVEENRRYFDVTREAMKRDFQLLAETVAHLNARIDATNANVERTAAETQALITLSHTELDRRVRVLEASRRPQKRQPR